MLRRLESHEVFRLLRPEQLRAISDAAEEMALGSGRTVFRQGDKADFFFVVLAGKVALRIPQAPGLSLEIDVVRPGEVFGSCLCFQLDSYALTAVCTADSKLLKIKAATLKRLLSEDPALGYRIQTQVAPAYFRRYAEATKKLQAVVDALVQKADKGAVARDAANGGWSRIVRG